MNSFAVIKKRIRRKVTTKQFIFYVSPSGADTNQGTLDEPFLSLDAVKNRIERLNIQNAVVFLRGGVYRLKDSFIIDSSLSNTSWRAYLGEKVIVTGGVSAIHVSNLTDSVGNNRIKHGLISKIKQIDLPFSDLGNIDPQKGNHFDVVFNGKYMQLARYPNQGWLSIGKSLQWLGNGRNIGPFHYLGVLPSWSSSNEIWIQGYMGVNWYYFYDQIASIDRINKVIYPMTPYQVFGYNLGQRYSFVNILEELDTVGEWYLDRSKSKLYFYPPSVINQVNTQFPLLNKPLLILNNANNVSIVGITFSVSRGNGVVINGGNNDLVGGCNFTNLAENAIVINKGLNDTITGCNIYEVGKGGIYVNSGNLATLSKGNTQVVNNKIYDFAINIKTYQPGISIYGVGNTVSNNEIHDAPHIAIFFAGNDNVIQYNNIYNVLTETNDAGAVYCGRNPAMQGNIIQFNYFHDIHGLPGYGAAAIYFDDHINGNKVQGNIFYNAGNNGPGQVFGAVFVHGGQYNDVENNIFINCKEAYGEVLWTDDILAKHINDDTWQKLLYQDVNINSNVYLSKYPKLKNVFTDRTPNTFSNNAIFNCAVSYNRSGPGNLIAKNNFIANSSNLDFASHRQRGFDLNQILSVFSTAPNFKIIPSRNIGVYTDKYRLERVLY